MKVLMLNESPHANGNTALALVEMEKIFAGKAMYGLPEKEDRISTNYI